MDEPMRHTLHTMQCSICTDNVCGGLRPLGQRRCNRCGLDTPCRPPVVGDIIAGGATAMPQAPDGAQLQGGNAAADPDAQQQHTDNCPVVAAPALPATFTARVRRLSHNTALHVPLSCRLRLLRITRQCWNRCADGDATWAALEEARSKLILGSVPQGMAVADEVAARMALWEAGEFTQLLDRMEQQRILIDRTRVRRQPQGVEDPDRRGKRARHLAAEGAFRKAAASLTSGMLPTTAAEDQAFAAELLPRTRRPDAALSSCAPV